MTEKPPREHGQGVASACWGGALQRFPLPCKLPHSSARNGTGFHSLLHFWCKKPMLPSWGLSFQHVDQFLKHHSPGSPGVFSHCWLFMCPPQVGMRFPGLSQVAPTCRQMNL